MNAFSSLRAIVWKELRFNWRWAVIGSVALLLDLLYQAQAGIDNSDIDYVWNGINSALFVGAPLIAIALGVLQIAPEQSRDRWAFLIHRPVRPSLLLCGKVVTGIFLYFLSTLVPFLCLALWVATPGHVPGPFDIRATLNGFVDILIGAPFYLAAMLCCIRQAKWYGTKFLPLCASLIVPVLAQACTVWWQAVVLVLLFTGLFGFCLWGAFGVPDGEQRRPFGRFAIGAVVVLAVSLPQPWVIALLLSMPLSHWPTTGSYGPSYRYEVLKSGDVVREEYLNDVLVGATGVGSSASSTVVGKYWDRSDPIQYMDSFRSRRQSLPLPFMANASYVPGPDQWPRDYADPIWYLFRGHLLEYSRETRQLQGELTVAGFKPESYVSGTGEFTVDNNVPRLVMADGRFYSRDGRSLTEVLDTTITGAVSGLKQVGKGNALAQTKKAIYLISSPGKVRMALPRLYPSLRLATAPDILGDISKGRVFVEYDTHAGSDTNLFTPSLLLEYSYSGALLRSQVLPSLPVRTGTIRHPLMALMAGFMCPALLRPVVTPALHLLTGNSELRISSLSGLLEFSRYDSDFALFCSGALAASLLSVLISVLISRRARVSRKSAGLWALCAFLLSFPAIVAQLSATEVPVRKVRKTAGDSTSTGIAAELGERRLLPEHRRINRPGAIFWKEIKSSWRWAALGALGLLVGVFGEMYVGSSRSQDLYSIWGSVQTCMALGSAVFGLGLSILQMYPEQSRDRWAFLVHRPATRDVLFFGKAAAGLLLYGIASSCSLLLVISWIACPGKFAFPFVWGLTLGSWMGVFCGAIFYFAGFLVMLRPVRWFGSRLFPVVAAGVWTALVMAMPAFWISAAVCLVFAAIMAYSAGSQFRIPAGGRVPGSGVISLGMILIFGIAATVVAGFVIAVSLYFMARPVVGHVGVDYVYSINSSGSITESKCIGGAVQSTSTIKPGSAKLPDGQSAVPLNLEDLWSANVSGNYPTYTNLSDYVQELAGDMRTNLRWYLVNNRVVTFSLEDNMEKGVLTPNGYVAGPVRNTSAEAFPVLVSSASVNILATRDTLYFLDLTDKAVYPAPLVSTPLTRIAQMSSTNYVDDITPNTQCAVVLNDNTLSIFTDKGRLAGALSVKDYRGYETGRIGMDMAGHLYLWCSGQNNTLENSRPQGDIVVETDPSGHTVGITRLPPLPGSGSSFSQSASSPPEYNSTISRVVMGCVMAPFITPRFVALVFHVPLSIVNDVYTQAFGHHRRDVVAGQILASLICGVIGWFIARRAQLSVLASVVWVLICAVLIWIGVLLLIALYAWPVRMRCPSCGKARFVEESKCRHCGKGWAPQARTGTEIFENLNETLHGGNEISREHLGTMR